MNKNLIQMLSEEKLYPIIRQKDASKAEDIANALIDGGVKILEINVENSKIYDVISNVSKRATVCAGSIITTWQANAAFNAGAKMFSSPIFQMNMVKISKNIGVPFIAGATTANEAYNAWKARIPMIKIFPTTALGGVQYIEDILRQMPFLNILPMGNIRVDEISSYLEAGAVAVGIGRDLCDCDNLNEITAKTKQIFESIRNK
ncbi:MAG: bifunctional 4-hydroxy-2-oxoglutarate aldolase/2-dehydro-3-deoxy-phosphogluconate aldolase [Candidatus Gastranaerophilales bacterium]|nr:bifunctional 4-hydroxy-2-oxoglutarate aldolase/2-dehydro-3-deoxy-phosphogluconate aldolase [Candidatus Gastranaerophilales bacterium]